MRIVSRSEAINSKRLSRPYIFIASQSAELGRRAHFRCTNFRLSITLALTSDDADWFVHYAGLVVLAGNVDPSRQTAGSTERRLRDTLYNFKRHNAS